MSLQEHAQLSQRFEKTSIEVVVGIPIVVFFVLFKERSTPINHIHHAMHLQRPS
ncbi:hypothetical protein JW711_05015 [Candidatus Woesearchaeota archaeon]|nr:hypothetical protein [Candidatus Woesearchaeota archaeon]